jgi:Mrp family chromosome partitioning ATPase
MSFIERVLGRAKEQGGAEYPARRRIVRRPSEAQSQVVARNFTRIALDPEVVAANNVLLKANDEMAVRAYKVARTRLLKRMAANNWQTVAITSAAPGDGKSLTAINLSLALALNTGTRVFLVDVDLQRPAIARYLGLTKSPDLGDYLAGEARLEQIIYDIAGTQVSVIPNFQPLQESSELLRSDRMHQLVAALRAEAPRRIIVFDMPPALVGDDVMAFAESTDCVMMVVSEGNTSRVALENARNVVAEMNLVGVVLNNATQSKDEAYAYY